MSKLAEPVSNSADRVPDTAPPGRVAVPYRFAPAAFAPARMRDALMAALRGDMEPAGRLVERDARGQTPAADDGSVLEHHLATAGMDDFSEGPVPPGSVAPLNQLYAEYSRGQQALLRERSRIYPRFERLLTDHLMRRLRMGDVVARGYRKKDDGTSRPIPREAWRSAVAPFMESGVHGLRFPSIGTAWFQVRIVKDYATIPVALAGLLVAGEDVRVGFDAPFLPTFGVLGSLASKVREAVLAGEMVLFARHGGRPERIPPEDVDRYPIAFDKGEMGPYRRVQAALSYRQEAVTRGVEVSSPAKKTIAAETEATRVLRDWAAHAQAGIRPMPRRPEARSALMRDIRGLSGEAFLRAWRAVAKEYPALSQGGRPRQNREPEG